MPPKLNPEETQRLGLAVWTAVVCALGGCGALHPPNPEPPVSERTHGGVVVDGPYSDADVEAIVERLHRRPGQVVLRVSPPDDFWYVDRGSVRDGPTLNVAEAQTEGPFRGGGRYYYLTKDREGWAIEDSTVWVE